MGQGDRETDREPGRGLLLLHAIAIWWCPHAVTLTLTTRHAAHGAVHSTRHGGTRRHRGVSSGNPARVDSVLCTR